MNGCQYLKPSFTLPASNNTSAIQWDFAFLTKKEFVAKWGEMLYADMKDDWDGRNN